MEGGGGAEFLLQALQQERQAHAATAAALEALKPVAAIVAENRQLAAQMEEAKRALDEAKRAYETLQQELFALVRAQGESERLAQQALAEQSKRRRLQLDSLYTIMVESMTKTASKEDLMDAMAVHLERMRLVV